MASISLTRVRHQGGFREAVQRGLGLKRTQRSLSRSPPPSPHLTGLLAPPAVTRSPSPALSDASNQSATQLVSHLSLGTTTYASGPSDLGANSTSNVPSTDHKRKKIRTAWTGLEIALESLKLGAELFPPLKSAVSDFASCLHIVRGVAENRKDYEELASELESMIDRLNKYAGKLGPEDLNGSIGNIALSIAKEVARIKEKQERSKVKRILESMQDEEDIIACYRRVKTLFGLLQDNVILWTVEKINKQDEFNLLQAMSPEEDARYNSHYSTTIKRHGCTAETREKVQADLQDWVRDPNGAKIYWMNGMAGTGKTTIAYSLCEWLEANKQLGANFFCSRAKDSCRDVSRIVPTIACQLARYSPAFRLALCKVLESDHGVSKLNVVQQFDKLIKGPLRKTEATIPDGVTIVIDALDECEDNYGVRLVLAALMRFATALPVKFFVSSRPEPGICEKIESSIDYSPAVLRLHDIEDSIVEGDIKKYLTEALSPISPPLSDEQVEQLAKHAGKLFIYAATVVRYILPDSVLANPNMRLKTMLGTGLQPTTNPRSRLKYKELDGLYTTILSAAFNEHLEEEEIEVIRLVLWTVVCAKEPMDAQALASLLALTEQQVLSALQPLRSVLHVSDDNIVSTLHASFADYMLDGLRSGKFSCDKEQHNYLLADRCFEVMQEELRFNICGLESSFMFDKDVPDLEERIKMSIPSALFYACRYWSEHLRFANASDELGDKLVDFLSHRLLFWMEVLNLNQCVVMGVSLLFQARNWMLINNIVDSTQKIVVDAQDFVTRFAASACTRSTPHIYVSALPFCAKESSVYMQYWGRTKGLVDVKGTAIRRRAQAAISTWMTDSSITAVGFSPNGVRIVSGSSDGAIRVWDALTGNVAVAFKGHPGLVTSIMFSPDGTCLASGSLDQTIRLWDARTGDAITRPFKGHTGPVFSVAFSSEGTRIVSGSSDWTIRVWNVCTGDTIAGPFEGHTDWVRSVAFSPDGARIASGSDDRTIRVWDACTGGIVAGPFRGHTRSVRSVAFSPDGSRIASGSDDETVRVWDACTGKAVARPFRGHADSVYSITFSLDGTRIASGSGDHTIRVWDARNGDVVTGPFAGHTGWVRSLAFSPDGARIVSGSDDRTIRVWDAWIGDVIVGLFKGHSARIHSVAFSPDGARIISSSQDRTIRVWDALTGDAIAGPFNGHTLSAYSVAFSPDGTRFVSGSSDQTIRVWVARTGEAAAGPFNGHARTVSSVAFSPDGTRIVSGSDDQTIRVWDARMGDTITGPLTGHTGSVRSVAFSLDGVRIVSGSDDQTVRVWDAHAGGCIAGPFKAHIYRAYSVTFSPHGTPLVSGTFNGALQVWDVETSDVVIGPFEGDTNQVNSVALAPNGAGIVSGSDDCTIRVWDVRAATLADVPFGWRTALNSSSKTAGTNWSLTTDGWVTLNNVPFVWISPDLQNCFPLPPHTLSIGYQGSIHIASWELLLGESWSLCYFPDGTL